MTIKELTSAPAPTWFYKWMLGISGTIFTILGFVIWFMFTGYINRQEKNWDAIEKRLDVFSSQYNNIQQSNSVQDIKITRTEQDVRDINNRVSVIERRTAR